MKNLLKNILALKNKTLTFFQSNEEIKMRELFGSYIKNDHVKDIVIYIDNSNKKIFYLNFARVTTIDIKFFKTLKQALGKKHNDVYIINLENLSKKFI